MITLLIEPQALDGEAVTVEGAAHRHLFRVRRLAPGAELRLVDGRGRARLGRIERVSRESARVLLGAAAPSNEPVLRLRLLVAPPRPSRAAWLVEKATEVGVDSIDLLRTGRGGRSPGAATLARLGRVAAAAVEQCGRSHLPAVSGPHPWGRLPGLLEGSERNYVLDPRLAEEAPAEGALPGGGAFAAETSGPAPAGAGGRDLPTASLLVGPEGGWTAAEREAMQRLGCRPISLGPRILRVETAAVVGAALVLLAR